MLQKQTESISMCQFLHMKIHIKTHICHMNKITVVNYKNNNDTNNNVSLGNNGY